MYEDISGKKYGKLTVQKMLYHYKNEETYCECICDCGNKIITRLNGLLTGNTQSCGCSKLFNLKGKTFGRLTVLEIHKNEKNRSVWKCLCECGNIVYVSSSRLVSGNTSSCGCLRNEKNSKGETMLISFFKENNIEYISEHTFKDCRGVGGKVLRFDFYLPNYNICIEYDGAQHFHPIEYFGGEKSFEILKEHDRIKNEYCKKNDITLIRIKYNEKYETVKENLLFIIQNLVTTTAA